ncbi:MAG: cytidylate kinase-like family protein [bacterium]|nr:cytidylate kinase-like family protein [bacterium]
MLITISRQYLAGAPAVALRVAEGLGWTVVDDDFVGAIAEKSGLSRDDVESLEESVPTFLERFAQSSALSFPEFLVSTPSAIEEPDAVKLAHITKEWIEELGHRDRIVLVGRAAAAILARERDVLHVRLVASRDHRIGLAMHEHGMGEAEAAAFLDERDRARARYHKENYGRDWNDPVHYHMVLNTELLGTDGAADLVIARARSVGWGASGD